MKVNLSYQVEFDKIPKEINDRYLQGIREALKDAYLHSLSIHYDGQNARHTLDQLDALISGTGDAADAITSATSIIIGYENELHRQQSAENEPQPQHSEPEHNQEVEAETVDGLIEEYAAADEVETDEH